MNKEVYLIRHGRTEFNRLGIWQGSGVDSSLDEVGEEQARKFYSRYKAEGFDVVFHSDLKRSKETVQAFIDDGTEAIESRLIREISWGKFEGHPHTEESISTYSRIIGAWQEDRYDEAFPGGESALQLGTRLGKFVEELLVFPAKKVLICSHGRAIRGLLCMMKNEPLKEMEKYKHANTGLFHARQIGSKFSFTSLNNTDHL